MKKAVIIDLDGTLINNTERAKRSYLPVPDNVSDRAAYWEPFFEESVFDDPNLWCLELVTAMNDLGYQIIFLTGRSATDNIISSTKRWLDSNIDENIKYDLIMRPPKDVRPDAVVKREIVMMELMQKYFILFAVDDQRKNVDMFESLNIPCLHCADY